jgi:hypothetical protein
LVELDQMQSEHDARAAEQAKAVSALKKRVVQEDLSVASSAFGALAELSGKNAEAQKAFAAAQTTVDTYLAAQKAFTSQLIPGDPTSPIRAYVAAAAAIVSGFVRVRAILSTNMKSPGGGAAGGGGYGSFGGFQTISQQPAGVQPTTPLDANGNVVQQTQQQNNQPIYVAVTEIRERGRQVEAIEQAVSFQ